MLLSSRHTRCATVWAKPPKRWSPRWLRGRVASARRRSSPWAFETVCGTVGGPAPASTRSLGCFRYPPDPDRPSDARADPGPGGFGDRALEPRAGGPGDGDQHRRHRGGPRTPTMRSGTPAADRRTMTSSASIASTLLPNSCARRPVSPGLPPWCRRRAPRAARSSAPRAA